MAFKQFFLILSLVYVNVNGHGMLWDPKNRGSLPESNSNTPRNVDAHGNNCGGIGTQFDKNKGKCGICGDDYSKTPPRDNELGGKYGEGTIVKNYTQGSKIKTIVRITSPHHGYFTFDLCNLDGEKETEKCFKKYPLKMTDGRDRYYIGHERKDYPVPLTLPPDVTCKHCVLRWQYTTGKDWGRCPNGTDKTGCGQQETFRTCSDIGILPKKKKGYKNWGKKFN